MQNVMVGFICGVMGAVGAWTIHKYGFKLGIVDVPNERSSHDNVIPKGGGIGILASFVFFSVYLGVSKSFWISGLFLALVSFVGDRLEIRPRVRLVVQFGCGLVFLIGLMTVSDAHFMGYLLIVPLSVFIVGTANFYNFMDGINGIAGITGVIGFLLLAVYGYGACADSVYIALSVAMACSCAGFLPFNVPRAKVFMGDVGSILLGFVFACMMVVISKDLSDFVCTAAFLFPFYLDELATMVVRIQDGDNLTHPHRKHIYQLLANECGIAHWKVAVSYGLSQLFIGISVIMVKPYGMIALISLLLFYSYIFKRFFVYIRRWVGLSKL